MGRCIAHVSYFLSLQVRNGLHLGTGRNHQLLIQCVAPLNRNNLEIALVSRKRCKKRRNFTCNCKVQLIGCNCQKLIIPPLENTVLDLVRRIIHVRLPEAQLPVRPARLADAQRYLA